METGKPPTIAMPPSHRGLQNLRKDLMIDLSRRIRTNPYDNATNREGIIDMRPAINGLMLDDLQAWLKKQKFGEKQRRSGKLNPSALTKWTVYLPDYTDPFYGAWSKKAAH